MKKVRRFSLLSALGMAAGTHSITLVERSDNLTHNLTHQLVDAIAASVRQVPTGSSVKPIRFGKRTQGDHDHLEAAQAKRDRKNQKRRADMVKTMLSNNCPSRWVWKVAPNPFV